jgi:hypothetical protein
MMTYDKEMLSAIFASPSALIERTVGSVDNIGKVIARVFWYDNLCESTVQLSKAQ